MAERSRTQRMIIVVAGWLGAAAVATGVALAAVSSIGTGIFGNSAGPLDQQDVTEALAGMTASPEPTATPSPTPEATATPGGDRTERAPEPSVEPTVITSPGGTVVARCTRDDRVEVLSWSPGQGYRVDNAEHGPAREIEVEFESGDREVEVNVRCVDGVPDAAIESSD